MTSLLRLYGLQFVCGWNAKDESWEYSATYEGRSLKGNAPSLKDVHERLTVFVSESNVG